MFYTVAEIASKLNLSKVAIYNKLKLKEIEPYIVKKAGVTYVSEEGLNFIKEGLNMFTTVKTEDAIDDETQDTPTGFSGNKELINALNCEIELLWKQIAEKDLQLKAKDDQIYKLTQLVENGQVLLKDKGQQELLALEDHFAQVNASLIELRERIQQKKENKSGFMSMFKKKSTD